jgi:transmembrane sensor
VNLLSMNVEDEEIIEPDPIRRQAYEWMVQFLGGEMTSSEIEAMKAWYRQSPAHLAAYTEVRRLWRDIGPVARNGMHKQSLVKRPKDTAPNSRYRLVQMDRRFVLGGVGGTAAAAVCYAIFKPPFDLWPSYAELTADYRTGTGEQRTVRLTDAVSFDLNTQTSIAVRSQTASRAEIVLVSGETLVSTNTPSLFLTVVAGNSRIRTNQSSFNVRHDRFQSCITCILGNLRIDRGGSTITLTSGQQVSFGASGSGAVLAADPAVVTAWQKGVLIFNATPVADVIEEVNRYRPGRIILMNDAIGQRLISAQLRIDDVSEIINQIVHIYGAKTTTLPENVIILT